MKMGDNIRCPYNIQVLFPPFVKSVIPYTFVDESVVLGTFVKPKLGIADVSRATNFSNKLTVFCLLKGAIPIGILLSVLSLLYMSHC